MIGILEITVLILLIFGYAFVFLLKTNKKNKKVLAETNPIRLLDEKDIKAMHLIEIESNLSVDPIPIVKRYPKWITSKEVWQFTDCDFNITSYTQGGRNKVIHYRFFTMINNEVIEVLVPEAFIAYLELHKRYKNKTIEVLYYFGHFTLFNIDGIIGYLSLYEKLTTNNGLERSPTKEELDAFMFSIWHSVWGLIFPVTLLYVPLTIGTGPEGLAIFFLTFPLSILTILILSIVTIPFCIAYVKRKKYLNSRKVHALEGVLSFDKKTHIYRINGEELKLHRKWKKILKKKELPLNNVKMEALLHTYDSKDMKAIKQFQPVSIKSDTLHLNEVILKSTRSWGAAFLYWLGFGVVARYTPRAAQENIFINPVYLFKVTDNYMFSLIVTLMWWGSIAITIYLSYLIVTRIKGHYFDD